MTTFTELLNLLACPYSKEPLKFTEYACTESGKTDGIYGVLSCSSYEYPVIDSVPVMLRKQVAQFSTGEGDIDSAGSDPKRLVEMIKSGDGFEALIECLSFTPSFSIVEKLPFWRLWHTGVVPKAGRKWIRKRIEQLLDSDDQDTLEEWLELFFNYQPDSNRELLNYYRHRFALPRTLAAYSILEQLCSNGKPILDIGCGIGPFPYFMVNHKKETPLVAFDFNFYLAWWQRRFMAQEHLFLCADGNEPLPFKDEAFGAIYCSDAFVYIPNKQALLSECQRCAPDRPLALTRVGNGDAYPLNWGEEKSASEYIDMLGTDTLAFREFDLVRCYLDRTNPLLLESRSAEELRHDKWINFIKNVDVAEVAKTRPTSDYPHAEGELVLNPIFALTNKADNRVRTALSFPSIWFTYQNADMLNYHGDKEVVDKVALAEAMNGTNAKERDELLKKFILIGLPKRYLRKKYYSPPSIS